MFHFSEQWRDSRMRKQLVDPASKYVGKTKIVHRSEEYISKKNSGMYHCRLVRTCKGVDEIENYTNTLEDVHGSSGHYAYHYFDGGDGIWRTDFIKLTFRVPGNP